MFIEVKILAGGEIHMNFKLPKKARIMLEPATVWHAEGMLERIDPSTAPNMQFCSEPITFERQVAYLRRMEESPTDHLWLILRRKDKAILGTIGLHEHDKFNHTARLGRWIFSAEDRCKGYGAEAVYQLFTGHAFKEISEFDQRVPDDEGFPLHKVYVNLFVTNTGGRKYYESLGFKEECVLEREYFLQGDYIDMVRLRLFKEEWEKLQGGE